MSVTTETTFKEEIPDEKNRCATIWSHVWRPFCLNGHFNYAFIYGSWEIVRARKVGTTHTKVDYVVYRLFYPVLLIGACLFAVVAEQNLGQFFCLFEVWCMILHMSYAFIFLQNVLSNNLHREPVRGRQKIPERLQVTDEIEKGGHKFYICKRFSILPTDNLYYTEQLLWLMFNIIVSSNVAIVYGHITNAILLNYPHMDNLEQIRSVCMGLLALADVIFTPIPMRIAHIIYPVCYCTLYSVFLYLLYTGSGIILYRNLNWGEDPVDVVNKIVARVCFVGFVHCVLCGLSKVRDQVISFLDDSRTAKQMQSLRSQKRLARRKLMNYVEGPDGGIIGITLEKHTHALDVFIKKEHNHHKDIPGADESSSSEEVDDKLLRKEDVAQEDTVPLSNIVKPPPPRRYDMPTQNGLTFSSSSSSNEGNVNVKKELQVHEDVRFPTPPTKEENEKAGEKGASGIAFKSKIPLPLHKLGLHLKPRDSKEAIHHKLSIDRHQQSDGDSPPTPPFIKLVQTMLKIHQDVKNVEEQQNKKARENSGIPAYGTVVRAQEKENTTGSEQRDNVPAPKMSRFPAPPIPNRKYDYGSWRRLSSNIGPRFETAEEKYARMRNLQQKLTSLKPPLKINVPGKAEEKLSQKDKPIAAKVIATPGYVREWKDHNKELFQDFHSELIHKLQKEHEKQGMGDTPVPPGEQPLPLQPKVKGHHAQTLTGSKPSEKRKKSTGIKGILKHRDGEKRHSHIKRREVQIAKRRTERAELGKQGRPAYDPLTEPSIRQKTTFHVLGTKLKGEKAEKRVVHPEDLYIYKNHPGIGPSDDVNERTGAGGVAPVEATKSLVTFHPIVRYFDVNEVKGQGTKRPSKVKKDFNLY